MKLSFLVLFLCLLGRFIPLNAQGIYLGDGVHFQCPKEYTFLEYDSKKNTSGKVPSEFQNALQSTLLAPGGLSFRYRSNQVGLLLPKNAGGAPVLIEKKRGALKYSEKLSKRFFSLLENALKEKGYQNINEFNVPKKLVLSGVHCAHKEMEITMGEDKFRLFSSLLPVQDYSIQISMISSKTSDGELYHSLVKSFTGAVNPPEQGGFSGLFLQAFLIAFFLFLLRVGGRFKG